MQITGQKPIVCRAKKSVANFKLREGMVIGVKVTLRDERTWCRNGNRSSDLTRLPGVFQPGNLVTYP